jgi:fructose-1,6-bisphosphatase/inositol monophosphatase family enzyme
VFESDLALAQRLADVADGIALRDFTGKPLVFTEKPDGSPVTETDPEIEAALRAIVAEERPGDGFLGEEVGATGSGPRRWVVDGIDGTIEFVAGRRGWSTAAARGTTPPWRSSWKRPEVGSATGTAGCGSTAADPGSSPTASCTTRP